MEEPLLKEEKQDLYLNLETKENHLLYCNPKLEEHQDDNLNVLAEKTQLIDLAPKTNTMSNESTEEKAISSSPLKTKASKKEYITTLVFGIITLFLLGKTTQAFYYGFKYYDIAHPNLNSQTPKTIVNQ